MMIKNCATTVVEVDVSSGDRVTADCIPDVLDSEEHVPDAATETGGDVARSFVNLDVAIDESLSVDEQLKAGKGNHSAAGEDHTRSAIPAVITAK